MHRSEVAHQQAFPREGKAGKGIPTRFRPDAVALLLVDLPGVSVDNTGAAFASRRHQKFQVLGRDQVIVVKEGHQRPARCAQPRVAGPGQAEVLRIGEIAESRSFGTIEGFDDL